MSKITMMMQAADSDRAAAAADAADRRHHGGRELLQADTTSFDSLLLHVGPGHVRLPLLHVYAMLPLSSLSMTLCIHFCVEIPSRA